MNPIIERLLSDVPMVRAETITAWLTPHEEHDRELVKVRAMAEPEWKRKIREEHTPQTTMTADGIAIVPVKGTLAYEPTTYEMIGYGLADSREVARQLTAAGRDPAVSGIVMEVNSPGGFHAGGPEVAEAVIEAAMNKPVVAWAGSTMASLAYMIGAQAHEVIASSSASVGSIGTIISFVDMSRMLEANGVRVEVITNKEGRYKGAGVPGTSLTESQRAYLQDRVDQAFGEFKSLVLSARPRVPEKAMQGQTFWAREAKAMGLVDAIGGLEFAVAACRKKSRNRESRK